MFILYETGAVVCIAIPFVCSELCLLPRWWCSRARVVRGVRAIVSGRFLLYFEVCVEKAEMPNDRGAQRERGEPR